MVKKGDVNKDGKITQEDYVLIQQYIINAVELDEEQLQAADVNNDGKVNLQDMVAIQKYLAGDIVKGDVDGDNRITKNDLLLVQQYIIDKVTFDTRQLIAADVNNDGKVSIMDMAAIISHLKGREILTEVVKYEI